LKKEQHVMAQKPNFVSLEEFVIKS